MKTLNYVLSVILIIIFTSSSVIAGEPSLLKVTFSQPTIYTKTIMVDDDDTIGEKGVASTIGGTILGTIGGCLLGGPFGCTIGMVAGSNGGALAGVAVGAATTDKIEKEIRVNGYKVVFDNGQVIYTPQQYKKGEKIPADKIVYDKIM